MRAMLAKRSGGMREHRKRAGKGVKRSEGADKAEVGEAQGPAAAEGVSCRVKGSPC